MKWEMVKLANVTNISKGKKHEETTDISGANRYIQIEDLSNNNNPKFTFETGTVVNETDLIIAWDGANAGKVGNRLNGVIGSTLARLRITREGIDPTFLFRFLDSQFENIKSKRTGATIPHVNGNELKNLLIPLPPLPTQRAIAARLDRADALRQKDRQLLRAYDDLAQSVFVEMFGEENPDNKKWPFIKLEEVAAKAKNSMRTGPFGSDLLHSEFVQSGVFVLGIDNVVNNRFEWSKSRFITEAKYQKLKRYTVFSGDMLISIMGTIGRVAIVPQDIPPAINSKHLAAITLNRERCNPSFIAFLLQVNPNIKKQVSLNGRGAIMSGLNLGIIKNLKFFLPPLALQTRFATILANIEQQKEIVRKQQAESEALFGRLLQEAFGG